MVVAVVVRAFNNKGMKPKQGSGIDSNGWARDGG